MAATVSMVAMFGKRAFSDGEETAAYAGISGGLGFWLRGGYKMTSPNWTKQRKIAAQVAGSRLFLMFMGVAVITSVVLVVLETDLRVDNKDAPAYLVVLDVALLVVYALEILLRLYIHQSFFLASFSNKLDLFILVAEVLVKVVRLAGADMLSLGFVRILRLGRVLRIFRVLLMFRELAMMVHGLASAMKAIFWATVMITLALMVWAIIAVEYIHPLVVQMAEDEGMFGDCERCLRAFSSVEMAMLTFLQTIVAGDSWGKVALPIIERHPATLLCFLPAFITIQLGLTNLVLAVIVDRAQEARQDDVGMVLSAKAEQFKKERARLLRLCISIDTDNNGQISKEELLKGFETHPEFADLLRYINLTQRELDMLFQVLDVDGKGFVLYREFVEQLYMMKTQETKTLMLYNMHLIRSNISEQLRLATETMIEKLKHTDAAVLKTQQTLNLSTMNCLNKSKGGSGSVLYESGSSLDCHEGGSGSLGEDSFLMPTRLGATHAPAERAPMQPLLENDQKGHPAEAEADDPLSLLQLTNHITEQLRNVEASILTKLQAAVGRRSNSSTSWDLTPGSNNSLSLTPLQSSVLHTPLQSPVHDDGMVRTSEARGAQDRNHVLEPSSNISTDGPEFSNCNIPSSGESGRGQPAELLTADVFGRSRSGQVVHM